MTSLLSLSSCPGLETRTPLIEVCGSSKSYYSLLPPPPSSSYYHHLPNSKTKLPFHLTAWLRLDRSNVSPIDQASTWKTKPSYTSQDAHLELWAARARWRRPMSLSMQEGWAAEGSGNLISWPNSPQTAMAGRCWRLRVQLSL